MLIKRLHNPKTQAYSEFKNSVLSWNFPWYYYENSVRNCLETQNFNNISFYAHTMLLRPEKVETKIPKPNSDYVNAASKVFLEIFEFNNLEINYFLRINANCVHSFDKVYNTVPHIDHPFEHKNAIIYLTSAGGSTIVGDEIHKPEENDVIIFGGETHYHETPKKDRRIVLVATFV